MRLVAELEAREEPIRVGVIGAGIFGSQAVCAAEGTPGMEIAGIADIDREKAVGTFRNGGVPSDEIAPADSASAVEAAVGRDQRAVAGDGLDLIDAGMDVILDATGVPDVAARHGFESIMAGTHFVNISVEADAVVGPLLADLADRAGVTYSLAYGDQPGQIVELHDWARTVGFEVVAAGRTTGDLEPYGTPDDALERHSWIGDFAERYDPTPRIYNSFQDGTKVAVESCVSANALGLEVDVPGMHVPEVAMDEVPGVLRPESDGGVLSESGAIDVVKPTDGGFSAFVVTRTDNDHLREYFSRRRYPPTASEGTYQFFHRPFHIAPETTVTIARAALRDEPTGAPAGQTAEVVGRAKRDLEPGEELDGGGGYTLYGDIEASDRAADRGYVPVELLEGAELVRPVERDEAVTYDHVELDDGRFIYELRALQDRRL